MVEVRSPSGNLQVSIWWHGEQREMIFFLKASNIISIKIISVILFENRLLEGMQYKLYP
jgi:hypothetical protein